MAKTKIITTESTEKPEDPKYQQLVKYCTDLYEVFKKSEYREEKIAEIQEARRIYEQKPDPKKENFPYEKAINQTLPFETITIDNLEPRLVAGLIGKDPILAFGAEGEKDSEETIFEEWFNKELKTYVKVDDAARNTIHTMLLEGTKYFLVEYDSDEIIRREFVFDADGNIQLDPATGRAVFEDIEDKSSEGGKLTHIPFTEVYIADDIDTMEKWEKSDRIIERNYTYGDLLEKNDKRGWRNIGAWLLPTATQKRLKDEDKTPSQIVAGVDVTGKETIKCIECHITYPIHNLSEEEVEEAKQATFLQERVIVTIALEQQLCIRQQLLRELNFNNESIFKRIRLFAEEGRSYGSGIHSKLKAVQEGASDLFNYLLNVAVMCMLPWYFYEEGAGIKGKQYIRPGEGLKVENIDRIKFPEYFKINPNQYIEFFKIFVDLWERIVSISEPQIGKTKSQQTTATEILTAVEEGNIKHNYQAKTFQEEFIAVLRTLYDLYYRNMPYDKTFEYGGKIVPLNRAQMARPKNFRLTGSTEQANKLIERKTSEDLYTLLGENPLVNPVVPLEDLLKGYGKNDTAKYIVPGLQDLIQIFLTAGPDVVMEALAPVVQQIQEAEMAQQGQGGQEKQAA